MTKGAHWPRFVIGTLVLVIGGAFILDRESFVQLGEGFAFDLADTLAS
jgi:hypothetical protein